MQLPHANCCRLGVFHLQGDLSRLSQVGHSLAQQHPCIRSGLAGLSGKVICDSTLVQISPFFLNYLLECRPLVISEEDVYLPFLTLAYSLELTMEVYILIPKTSQTPKPRILNPIILSDPAANLQSPEPGLIPGADDGERGIDRLFRQCRCIRNHR